jgi:hypothetical protein
LSGQWAVVASHSSVREAEGCLVHRGVPGDEFVDADELQYLFYMFVDPGQSQLSTSLLHLPGGGHDDPNASAVDMRHAGQIEDDLFFLLLVDKAVDRPFQLLTLSADRDSSRDLQHNDIGWQLPGLNLKHERNPFL